MTPGDRRTAWNSTLPERSKPLRSSPWPRPGLSVVVAGGAPVVPIRRQRSNTGFSAAVKLKVRQRAGNGLAEDARCEACGIWLGRYGGQVHHRDNRGMGGSKDPVINSIVNAALLCGNPVDLSTCHGKCTASDRRMNAEGWWLKEGQDPAQTSVLLHSPGGSGLEVWLTADGYYGYVPPDGGAA